MPSQRTQQGIHQLQRANAEPGRRRGQGSLKEPSQRTKPTARHTTNPPDSCLGRSLLITDISKRRRRSAGVFSAPPGGRFWHGFRVAPPPGGRGGGAARFGSPFGR